MSSVVLIMQNNYKHIKVSACATYHQLAGQPITDKTYHWVMKFHFPGFAPVADDSGSYHIDIDGQPAYVQRYQKVYGFYDECAAVVDHNDRWFHVNTEGNPLYIGNYHWCGNFQEECCVTQSENGFQHILKSGYSLYAAYYDYVGDYKDGIAVAVKNGRFFHIDCNGCRMNNLDYLFLDIFHKGFARAQDDQGWFHVNKQGTAVYKNRYKYVEPYYNGMALVQTFDQQFVRINEKGEVIDIITANHSDGVAELSSKMVSFWSIYVISTALSIGIFERLSRGKMHIDQLIKVLKPESVHHSDKLLDASSHKDIIDEQNLLRLLRGLWEINLVHYDKTMWQLTDLGILLVNSPDHFMADASHMWLAVMQQWQTQPLLTLLKQKPENHRCFKDDADIEDLRIYHRALIGYAHRDFATISDHVIFAQNTSILVAGTCARVIIPHLASKYTECHFTYYDNKARLRDFELGQSLKNVSVADFDLLSAWHEKYDYLIFPRYLHYWSDREMPLLLDHASKALNRHGKLIVLEMLIDEDTPQGSLLDLNMMIETGGRLRSRQMWEHLMQSPALVLTKHLSLKSYLSMLEFSHVNN